MTSQSHDFTESKGGIGEPIDPLLGLLTTLRASFGPHSEAHLPAGMALFWDIPRGSFLPTIEGFRGVRRAYEGG